jgi:hypothetical protein
MKRKPHLQQDALAGLERNPAKALAKTGVSQKRTRRTRGLVRGNAATTQPREGEAKRVSLAAGVHHTDNSRPSDTDLAAAALDAIKWLTTVPQESINVTASKAWLYLEGTVNSRHQRSIIEEVTRHLPGVQGVTDLIMIKPAPTSVVLGKATWIPIRPSSSYLEAA